MAVSHCSDRSAPEFCGCLHVYIPGPTGSCSIIESHPFAFCTSWHLILRIFEYRLHARALHRIRADPSRIQYSSVAAAKVPFPFVSVFCSGLPQKRPFSSHFTCATSLHLNDQIRGPHSEQLSSISHIFPPSVQSCRPRHLCYCRAQAYNLPVRQEGLLCRGTTTGASLILVFASNIPGLTVGHCSR